MNRSRGESREFREWRRLRALELSRRGWKQRDIAIALDVSEGAVSRWLSTARHHGPGALHSHPAPGRPAQLTDEQLQRLPDLLWHGPEVYGFRGDVWTCDRVVGVLFEEFGVSYSKSWVSRLLKQLGWTPQVPDTRALQRNEPAIERWRVKTWPGLQEKARRERRTLVFGDESGFYLLPGLTKTYAPRGHTPIVDECQTRDHLSVMGGLTPQGQVYTLIREETLTGLHSIAFLTHLLRLTQSRLLVIWDGSMIHRRAELRAFVAQQVGSSSIHLEALPGYAPDLNPVEGLWQHLKHVELPNVTCLDIEQLRMELDLAIGRVKRQPDLLQSFFDAARLTL